jgi:hypothetical protein
VFEISCAGFSSRDVLLGEYGEGLLSSKTGMFALALALAATGAVVLLVDLSPWVMVGVLGVAALVRGAAAFRREQQTLDRILLEELGPCDDEIGAPVEINRHRSPSRLPFNAGRHLHRAS